MSRVHPSSDHQLVDDYERDVEDDVVDDEREELPQDIAKGQVPVEPPRARPCPVPPPGNLDAAQVIQER